MPLDRKPVRILLTGGSGLLGSHLIARRPPWADLVATYHTRPIRPAGAEAAYLDLADPSGPEKIIRSAEPDAIVHAAAIADPDTCERDPDGARRVNASGTLALAKAARERGVRFIYISTDLVFDGTAAPYGEGALPNPLQAYGRTKLEAERAVRAHLPDHLIVRPSLLYGEPLGGNDNPITWMMKKVAKGEPIVCFEDQVRSPTWAGDAAGAIYKAIGCALRGCLHLGGPEGLNRFEFAKIAAGAFGWPDEVLLKSRSTSFPQAAVRPRDCHFRIDRMRRELGYEPERAQNIMPSIVRSFLGADGKES